jgi:hypothetical protein
MYNKEVGRDSAVSVATAYGLDCAGIESQLGGGTRFSTPFETSPGAHPGSYTVGTDFFPGVKQPGRGIDHPPPHLEPRWKKE